MFPSVISLNSDNKRLLKYFILIFMVVALIWNWRYLSWAFNYGVIGDGVDYVAQKINPENALPILRYNPLASTNNTVPVISTLIVPGGDISQNNQGTAPVNVINYDYLSRPHIIEIPKISIKAPIMFSTSTNPKVFTSLLKKGTMHFPTSALPGQEGAVVILGHSSSPYWPKINYDWVFSDLNKLEKGDEVTIDFNGERYQYRVVNKYVLDKGGELKADLTKGENMLILVTCWPPGRNRQRLVVEGILQ